MGPAFRPDIKAGQESCSDTGFVIGETNCAIKHYVLQAESKAEVHRGGGKFVTNKHGDPLYENEEYLRSGQEALAVLWEINAGANFVGEATLTSKNIYHVDDITEHYKANE